jgi:iron complex transport system substrate-binding protein
MANADHALRLLLPTQLTPDLERYPAGILRRVSQRLRNGAPSVPVLGKPTEGLALVDGIRTRLAALAERTRALPRPTVVCLEWIEPAFAMGNWGPELVELAGGTNLLGTPGAHSTTTPWSAVQEADPDILVVALCGFGLERALQEMHLLAAQPGWHELRAVQSDRVFVADGNLYFNRSGPSMFETPEILAEIMHPNDFAPNHRGHVWQRWAVLP